MNNIQKEFDSFESWLKIYMKGMKVRSVTRNYLSEASGNNYGNYTIEQFIILYKLNRMEELGVINEDIASNLRELLDMKMHVGSIIGEEAKRALYDPTYQTEDLSKLHKMTEKIDNHLKKYHLTMDDISLKDMIDTSIKEENKESIKDNNNIRIKRIG